MHAETLLHLLQALPHKKAMPRPGMLSTGFFVVTVREI